MKHVTGFAFSTSLVGLLIALIFPASAFAAASLQMVACPDRDLPRLDLYNSSAAPTGIKIEAYEPINVFSGWGKNVITKGQGLSELRFVRVQIPGEENLVDQTIYIYEGAITTAAACQARRGDGGPAAARAQSAISSDEDDDLAEDAAPAPDHPAVESSNGVGGLTNPNCCGFPLHTRTRSFLGGIAKFGAGRSIRSRGRVVGSRTHGGSDLYGTRGQAVVAVAEGTVIRAPYMFKRPCLAVDIRHAGGFVVRYGEITGKSFRLGVGVKVKKGQQIGAMGYVPGAPSPMIHFELYKGNLAGKLSQSGNTYMRRGDLLNPTSYLRRWGQI